MQWNAERVFIQQLGVLEWRFGLVGLEDRIEVQGMVPQRGVNPPVIEGVWRSDRGVGVRMT